MAAATSSLPEPFSPVTSTRPSAGAMRPTLVIEGGIVHGMLAMDSYVFGVAGESVRQRLGELPQAAPR